MRLITWYAPQLVLTVLAGAAFDGILLGDAHRTSRLLHILLAAIFGLSLVLAWLARRTAPEGRRPLERLWSSLDQYGAVWLAVFLTFVFVFHVAFTRVGGDGRSYFVQLHALFIGPDLDMDREARTFGAESPAIFPLGSAVLWLPFYATAHGWLAALNVFGAGLQRNATL